MFSLGVVMVLVVLVGLVVLGSGLYSRCDLWVVLFMAFGFAFWFWGFVILLLVLASCGVV